MNTKLQLSHTEVLVLEKLARRSKMDCWFYADENGKVIDLEENSRTIGTKRACKALVEGLTEYDIACLNPEEIITLLNLLNK